MKRKLKELWESGNETVNGNRRERQRKEKLGSWVREL